MKRREFITLVGGAAATWPVVAQAQQQELMRHIGVLMLYPESDSEGQLRATAFREGLAKLGWVVGRNVQIDFKWGFGDADWTTVLRCGERGDATCERFALHTHR
jgi:putative ABC transport system substrate-binding protein